MNSRNPKFWALIGFGVGAVIASAGTVVHPLDSLFGGLIQAALWFGVSSFILRKKPVKSQNSLTTTNLGYSLKNSEAINKKEIDLTSIKTCSKCGRTVPMERSWCKDCSGTSFTHSQIPAYEVPQSSEEALADFFPPEKIKEQQVPEFKLCLMCAEEIRYAAKKCRYCQHMQDA